MPSILIKSATSPADIADARRLMRIFAENLDQEHGVSLAFQNIDAELAALPKPYSVILLAQRAPLKGAAQQTSNKKISKKTADHDGQNEKISDSIGVVALKALPHMGPAYCELKRLYVDPSARGLHVGEKLCRQLMEEAKKRGHRHMLLDSLDRLGPALRLYDRLGFAPTKAYCYNPFADAAFRQKDL